MLFFDKKPISRNLKETSLKELGYDKYTINLINEIKIKIFKKELETKWLF